MAIPESQLETWTGQGAASGSATTYQAVRQAICSHISGRNLDVYLQGSYRNDTNIRGDSDVDVVVECRESQFSNPSRLQGANRQWWESLPGASYTWDQFRHDVHQALVTYFGPDQVRDGNK
ncbi:MAG: nucleotidyltransferase, partial [Chloroflexi bacterium]|nr:nucleotidyltransferase [Chloroflexota bacterium]